MRLKDLPKFKRPREKLFEKGAEALKDYELLAILLRTGYAGKSALEVAKRILSTHTLENILNTNSQTLSKIKGIGKSRAATISASLELVKRYLGVNKEIKIKTSEDIAKAADFIKNKKQEHLIAFYLNARGNIIATQTISIGTINASLIHPREVFAPALEFRASQVALAHNHPAGDPKPSFDDLAVTKKLKQASELLGIDFLDHVIVAKNGFESCKA